MATKKIKQGEEEDKRGKDNRWNEKVRGIYRSKESKGGSKRWRMDLGGGGVTRCQESGRMWWWWHRLVVEWRWPGMACVWQRGSRQTQGPSDLPHAPWHAEKPLTPNWNDKLALQRQELCYALWYQSGNTYMSHFLLISGYQSTKAIMLTWSSIL